MMAFNTAIFYDIENLLRGYSFTTRTAANLSLKSILDEVRATGVLGEIAVQRAYANWSDARLGFMRSEIAALGIDPIQVFAFNRGQKRNAADIQLAVDAIDLCYVRPAIDVFVIVSGDGGFSSLARKLHEYGKKVIGCAYEDSTNRFFAAVCDAFVEIEDPEGFEEALEQPKPVAPATDPRIQILLNQVRRQDLADPLEGCRLIVKFISQSRHYSGELNHGGLHLTPVQQAIATAIPGLLPIKATGHLKFADFLRCICAGSTLCLARPAAGQPMLLSRAAVPQDWTVLPDLMLRDVNAAETYTAILQTDAPVFRVPPVGDLRQVIEWLADNPIANLPLGTVIDQASNALAGAVPPESVKSALLCLSSAGVFIRDPAGARLSEQTFTLLDENRAAGAMFSRLRQAMHDKIATILGSVSGPVFDEMFPPAA